MATRVLSGPFLRVTVANFFFFLNFASFFLLPLHVKALGGSESMVGMVMGTNGVASLLALPLIGIAIDRYGRRRFLIGGAVGMTAAAVGFVFVDRIGPAMFALRVVQGLSFAGAFTATTTLAADLAPAARRAQAFGIFGVSTLLTHAMAPGIGEEIVRRGGFEALFITAAVCSCVTILVGSRLPAPPARPHASEHTRGWQVSPAQWAVLATMTLAGMGFGTVTTFIATFVRGEHLGRVGLFFAAYSAAAILTRLGGGGVSDTYGRRAVIMPALLTLAAAILSLTQVRSLTMLAVIGFVFGCAQGISYPTLHALLIDLTPPTHLGRAQALFNGSFNIGVTSAAFIFGLVADHAGYRVMFAIAGLTPLAACALLFRYGRDPVGTAVVSTATDG